MLLAGHYVSSRASRTNFFKAVNLISGTTVALNQDDTITVGALANAAGVPKSWREVGPYQWQEVGGTDRLGALVQNGHVIRFAPAAFAPIIEFVPAPASLNAGWIMPVAGLALLVMLLTALSWPIVAIARRIYGYSPGIAGRGLMLHRATRATAWLMLLLPVGWALLISVMVGHADSLDGRLDGWMRVLQLVLVLGIVGTALSIWNVQSVSSRPGRHRFASAWSVIFVVSALFLVWLALDVKLLTLSLDF